MNLFRRQNILYLITGLVLLFIIVGIVIVSINPGEEEQINTTLTPTQVQILPSPQLEYAPGSAQKMLNKLSAEQQLSTSDISAKEKILSILPVGQVSGVIYSSPTIIIDYTQAADQFQVEILTIDIKLAKNEAIAWLQSQGLSQQAICDLPVIFYINKAVLNQFKEETVQFNPLAESC